MRCHYWKAEDGKKYLIPGCYPVAHSMDKSDCTCEPTVRSTKAELIKFKKKQIDDLLAEIEEIKNASYFTI